jgi:hypothetical protein
MKALSLGQIGKLAGYRRTRIYQLAVSGRIPFEPIKQPPAGQYRYADTPEIREWCELKRKTKPQRRNRPTRFVRRGKLRADISAFVETLEAGRADRNDLVFATNLFASSQPLFEPPSCWDDLPCTRGVLAWLCFVLLRSRSSLRRDFMQLAMDWEATAQKLAKAIAKLPESQGSSPPPAA